MIGKLYLFFGMDRISKFVVTQLVDKANRKTVWEFPEYLPEAVPYHIHTILTYSASSSPSNPETETQHILDLCVLT